MYNAIVSAFTLSDDSSENIPERTNSTSPSMRRNSNIANTAIMVIIFFFIF